MDTRKHKPNYVAFIGAGVALIGAGIALGASVNPGLYGISAVGFAFIAIAMSVRKRSDK